MFIGQGASGLPEDRAVNVFHFVGTAAYAADGPSAAARVVTFYTGLTGAQVNPIGAYLSPWIQRAAELRTYDLSTGPPRVPTITPITLPAALNNSGLPEEIALVSTFFGSPPVTRRRRGRMYLGPLNGAAAVINYGSTSAPSSPANQIVLDLRDATKQLAVAADVQLSIRSTLPTPNFVPVAAGYVDNAFDTQRRRGPDPTSRTEWTNILP